jgi:branched-chain amino acid transport system substrate-binding protein
MRKDASPTTRGFPWTTFLAIAASCLMAIGTTALGADRVAKVGAVTDLSGPTSEVGKPFASGVRDYFELINRDGGVNGIKIKLMQTDCAYNLAQETNAFKRFASEGIVVFIGWSSGGILQIGRMASKKHIVMFGGGLFDITKVAPYYFAHCATYDRIWSALVKYAVSQNGGKPLKAAIVYPDNPFGQANVKMLRSDLKKRGCKLLGEEVVGFKDIDATAQMLKIKALSPDAVFMVAVEPSQAVIMRDARKVGIDQKKVKFYTNFPGVGPVGIKLGGKNIEDVVGGSPFSSSEEKNLPGIQKLRKANPGKESRLTWYVHGWTTSLVICEGLRRLGKKKITGENLKKALESIKGLDTGGVTAPISYSATNHIGTHGVKLFRPNIEKGYWEPISDFIKVD